MGAETVELPIRCIDVITMDHIGVGLAYPSTVFYDALGDEIYITDAAKGQLVIYTSDYFPQVSVGAGRGLNSIYSCYIKNGQLFVCLGTSKQDSQGHIAILNEAFLPAGKIYFSGFEQSASFLPRKMVVGGKGRLYVVGVNSSEVIVLDSAGNYLHNITPEDEFLGVKEPASIISLTIGRDGRLYFLSEARGRVFVYDKDEQFLYKFGQKGGDRGKLARPRGIAVDDQGKRVYIVDYLRHSVSVYSIKGDFLYEFGGKGYGRGWFLYPTDICIDGWGRLLITDTFNHRVQVFEIDNK